MNVIYAAAAHVPSRSGSGSSGSGCRSEQNGKQKHHDNHHLPADG